MRPRAERRMTLADYEVLADDGFYNDELSRGYLVREPRPGDQHAELEE